MFAFGRKMVMNKLETKQSFLSVFEKKLFWYFVIISNFKAFYQAFKSTEIIRLGFAMFLIPPQKKLLSLAQHFQYFHTAFESEKTLTDTATLSNSRVLTWIYQHMAMILQINLISFLLLASLIIFFRDKKYKKKNRANTELDYFSLTFRDRKKLAMLLSLRFILGAGRVVSRSLILATRAQVLRQTVSGLISYP